MSLFDPSTTNDESRLFEYGPDGSASGEHIPKLPAARKVELTRRLLKAGVRIARSPNHEDGWEEAYTAFAEELRQAGGKLTEPLLSMDIPNMLFNFALTHSWFPHLTAMLTHSDVPEITFPTRMTSDVFSNRNRSGRQVSELSKEQSLSWYRDRIRPAVMQWVAVITDKQMEYDFLRDEILEFCAREAQVVDDLDAHPEPPLSVAIETDDDRQKRRAELLAEYKKRVKSECGKKVTNYALYSAKQHSMHKPQFYEWVKGKLASGTQSFERFLSEGKPPIPRNGKK
jgi:hypothetical protein